MLTKKVKISVVMPIYNVESFVKQAVDSVLAQSMTQLELIIVNDCSPDNSLAICQKYTDPRIRIINHELNRGLAAARNTGIRHARGDIIAFLDSDDLWHTDKLSQHLQHLQNNPEIGMSFSRSEFIEPTGIRTGYHQMPKLSQITARDILCRNPVGNGSAPVIRRSVLEQISYEDSFHGQAETCYFDASLRQSEDVECWLRIALQTQWKIEGLSQALTYYRLNAGGLSSNLFKQYDSWENVIERTRVYAAEFIGCTEKMARAYQLRYLSRQAIRLCDGKMAIYFLHRALAVNHSILFQEPARTLATMTAAYLMSCTPRSMYAAMEAVGGYLVGRLQKIRISREMQTNGQV